MITVRELIQYLSENASMDDLVGVSDQVVGHVSAVVEMEVQDYTEKQALIVLNIGDQSSATILKDDEGIYVYEDETEATADGN